MFDALDGAFLTRPIHSLIAAILLVAIAATTASAFLWWGSSPVASPTATPTATPVPSSTPSPTPTRSVTRTPTPKATPGPLAKRIVGGEFDFIVADGNSFSRIGSRFGIGPKVLARENGRDMDKALVAGDVLHIDNRHIAPLERADGIVINIPQRMLFHFEDRRITGAYPVALGQPARKWQTPMGAFKVIQLREDPTWRVPASIQQEMEAEGKEVIDEVEPGPDNPLGKFWIGLSLPVLGIHGTNHPRSIYSFRTHGCIRLHPDDVEALYESTDYNDGGEIVYLPLMLARLDDGRIFLESQRDIYRRGTGGIDAVRALAGVSRIENLIDWSRSEQVVNDADGIARDVTMRTGETNAVSAAGATK